MRSFSGILLLVLALGGCSQTAHFGDGGHVQFIDLAIRGYGDKNGTFPDNIYDRPGGKPLLSWRVAVLPFGSLEDKAIYDKLRLSEAWNSPHNLKVAKENIPEMYRDPNGSEYCPYLAVTGKWNAFCPGHPASRNLASPHRTAIVVTTDAEKILWTEPRDISVEQAKDAMKKGKLRDYYLAHDQVPSKISEDPKPEFEP